MTLSSIARMSEKFVVDNSPSILTTVGVVGTLSTALLTGKASFKAADILAVEQEAMDYLDKGQLLERNEKFRLVWVEFLPAVGVGVLTVVAIVGANHIGGRRAAAIGAAYALSERSFTEYKEKVREKLTAPKAQAIQDEVQQDRVNKTPGSTEVIITGTDVVCFDAYSGRYFTSNMETLKKAQNDTNYQINNEMYASLSDFYGRVGLDATSASEEVGWNSDKLLELEFSTTLTRDQRPCLCIDFQVKPIRGYYRLH